VPLQPGRLVILTFAIVLGGAVAAGMAGRMIEDARRGTFSLAGFGEGLLGLAAMVALVYGAYRLVRWGIRSLRGG